MDEKEIKSLIEHTFGNTGQKPAVFEMSDDGKQYINSLVDYCKESNKKFPYTSAFRVCKDKFAFTGSPDAFRRAIIRIESGDLVL